MLPLHDESRDCHHEQQAHHTADDDQFFLPLPPPYRKFFCLLQFIESPPTLFHGGFKRCVGDDGRGEHAPILVCECESLLDVLPIVCLRETFNGSRALVRKELQIFSGCQDCIGLQFRRDTAEHFQCFIETDFFAKLLHFLQQRLDLRLMLLFAGHELLTQQLVPFRGITFKKQKFVNPGQQSLQLIIFYCLINGPLQAL